MDVERIVTEELFRKLQEDSLILPSLPDVAIEVENVMNRPSSNIKQVVEVVKKDTAITAKVIRVANSAMYCRGRRADNLQAAIIRIGFDQIKSIVTSLALEQLFISSNEMVWKVMDEVWNCSVEIAAASCSLLIQYQKNNQQSKLDVETLTLAALVHNIGALPVLAEAEIHPDLFEDVSVLRKVIQHVQTPIGTAIVKCWDFTDEIIEVIEHLSDFSYITDEVTYLDFIRAAALYLGMIKSQQSIASKMDFYTIKGLPTSGEELASDAFLAQYRDIKKSYQ
ncbi:HDOD domain-containing protein [Shewanella sp. 202IG2-18]|uniref:HDOD domain-containing protein n=1 Tax=Parashewanella hymeniacidonis TaxID=2807618 RepID=UPI001961E0F1|nr:HDOD domain-containing protein [Parashewanella hymeniacidonis]MBM7071012.1 HDOD domain-containing protein [Parashewanella hymeniacidonis]